MLVVRAENLIKRIFQYRAIKHAVYGHLFLTVMHPEIHDTLVVELTAHLVGNSAATLGVLDPEISDALVGVTQREIARLGVRERCGVKIKFETIGLGPVDPALEMLDTHFIAVNIFAAKLAIDFVKVDAVAATQQ